MIKAVINTDGLPTLSNSSATGLVKFAIVAVVTACMTCACSKRGTCEKDSTIVAARGCGEFVLGRKVGLTKAEEEHFSKSGLFFETDSDSRLAAVVVSSPTFRDDAGIRVGDPEPIAIARRGESQVRELSLRKGDTTIGRIGDRVLVYRGIEYVISAEKVWAIRVMQR